ncbi:uncharacterized protein LOC144422720 isoform X2 [Styela clava]
MDVLQNVLSQFEKSVQCAICLSTLKNPVTTRCNHNFCTYCIRQALKGKVEIPCPLCKKTVRQRSLKQAFQLHSLITTVNRVTNTVQEQAGLPFTLSQSTREDVTGNIQEFDNPSLSNGHIELPEGFTLPDLGSPIPAFGLPLSQNNSGAPEIQNEDVLMPNGSARDNIAEDHTYVAGIRVEAAAEISYIEKIKNQNRVTVSVDVHHSPMAPQILRTPTSVRSTAKTNGLSSGQDQQQLPTINLSKGNGNYKELVNGSAITSYDNNNNDLHSVDITEIAHDIFEFPNSQRTYPTDKTKKKNSKQRKEKNKAGKSNVKKRKMPVSDGELVAPLRKRLKKSRKIRSEPVLTDGGGEQMTDDGERGNMSPIMKDNNAHSPEIEYELAKEMVQEVEQHSLTIEKVEVSPQKAVKEKCNKVKLKKIAKSPGKIEDQSSKEKKQRNARRLLSDSSSASSISGDYPEADKQVLIKEHASQQTVKEKVNNWLETATPTASSDIQSISPSSQSCQQESKTSDDDLISHSQVSIGNLSDHVITTVKRRKLVSPVKLDPQIQESVRNQLWSRDVAVFGSAKPKNTFLLKNRKSLGSSLWPAESSTSSEDGRIGKTKNRSVKVRKKKISLVEKAITIEGRERKKGKANKNDPSPQEESIFNVPGLSQGVSPFGTPMEASNNNDHNVHQHQNVIENNENDLMDEILKPDVLTEAMKGIITEISSENYEIEDMDNAVNPVRQNNVPQTPTSDTQNSSKSSLVQVVTQEDAIVALSTIAHGSVCITAGNEITDTKGDDKQNDKAPIATSVPNVNMVNTTAQGSDLPLLGDSPTVQTASQKISVIPRTTKPVGVELGLLDFSEHMISTSQDKNKKFLNIKRPNAVAKTCRMVLEKFGDLANIQKTSPAKVVEVSERKTRSKTTNIAGQASKESNRKNLSPGYDTDDTVIPPSTSTAELGLADTPQHCDLNEIPQPPPEPVSSEDDRETDDARDVDMEKVVDTVVEILPDGSTASSAVAVTSDSFVSEDESVPPEGTEVKKGTLQCLTNGWGGTKLRIFKSGSSGVSDEDSGFSARKKLTTTSDLMSGNSGGILAKPNGDKKIQKLISSTIDMDRHLVANELSSSKTIQATTKFSTDIIPNSEKITEGEIDSAQQNVRKSSRRNKGKRVDLEYITTQYNKSKNITDQLPDSSTSDKPMVPNEALDNVNPVLQHIEEAIAEADTTYINWMDNPTDSQKQQKTSGTKVVEKTPKKLSQNSGNTRRPSKDKGTKSSPLKKQILKKKPTGKRTKNNKVKLNERKPSSADEMKVNGESVSDDEYFNRSWPLESKRNETFSCSLPNALPKSITDVSVILRRIDSSNLPSKIKVANERRRDKLELESIEPLVIDENDDSLWNDVIDASPMLFDTQQDNEEVGRPSDDKNTKGRVLNIDLREMNELSDLKTTFVPGESIDDIGLIDDEADDVICCSWNEEADHMRGPKAASCHEDMSSVNSNEQPIKQSSNILEGIKSKDANDTEQSNESQKNNEEVQDQFFEHVLHSLQKICSIDKSKASTLFPQSSTILVQAIEICENARTSIQKEQETIREVRTTSAISENIVEIKKKETASTSEITTSQLSTGKTNKRRGRPPGSKKIKQKSDSSQSSQLRKSPRRPTEVTRKDFKNTNKNDEVASPSMRSKDFNSMSQVSKGKGLKVPTSNKHYGKMGNDSKVEDEHDWHFDDEDDVVMFTEDECKQNNDGGSVSSTNKSVQKHSKQSKMYKERDVIYNSQPQQDESMTASMEQAMIAVDMDMTEVDQFKQKRKTRNTTSNNNGDILEEIKFDDDTHMNDTVGPSQGNPDEDDDTQNVNHNDVVAANVDSWLRRLSDLNKREGDKQKQKIGDRWTSPSSSECDGTVANVEDNLKTNDFGGKRKSPTKQSVKNKTTENTKKKKSSNKREEQSTTAGFASEKISGGAESEFADKDTLQQWLNSSQKSETNGKSQRIMSDDDIQDIELENFIENRNADLQQSLQQSFDKTDDTPKQKIQTTKVKGDEENSSINKTSNNEKLNAKVNGTNAGLNFSSQASQHHSFNIMDSFSSKLLNTKVVLEKLDEDIIINCSPPSVSDMFSMDKSNAPKVQQWLESSQPEMASPAHSLNDMEVVPERLGFITTGIQERGIKYVCLFANKYNGQFYSQFDRDNVTHIIVRASEQRNCDRTLKYLQGIAAKKWVVSLKWVTDSLEMDKKLPEAEYEVLGDNFVNDVESDGCEILQGPMRSRTSDPNYKLLKGYRCVCLPPYSLISVDQASQLLEMCGATVAKHLGDLVQSSSDNSTNFAEHKLIIVDVEGASGPDYVAMGQQFGAEVVSVEWLYETISRFHVQPYDEFVVTQNYEMTQS